MQRLLFSTFLESFHGKGCSFEAKGRGLGSRTDRGQTDGSRRREGLEPREGSGDYERVPQVPVPRRLGDADQRFRARRALGWGG